MPRYKRPISKIAIAEANHPEVLALVNELASLRNKAPSTVVAETLLAVLPDRIQQVRANVKT